MNNYIFEHEGKTYKRITKSAARKNYEHGADIVLCPCNLRPFGFWNNGVKVNNKSGRGFNSLVNEFNYYNCINAETGRYIAFYSAE